MTKQAKILINNNEAGVLTEIQKGKNYLFKYNSNYTDEPISITMPTNTAQYEFKTFPPFFDGLLPEGNQLEALLKQNKIDKNDLFSQLIVVGEDLVGNVTVKPI